MESVTVDHPWRKWTIHPSIPDGWTPEEAVKPKVAEIINEFWIAHEQIVTKKIKGWTWDRFCKEAGYNRQTPLLWFQKYELPYTGEKITPAFAGLPKPAKQHTKPETKIQLEKTVEAIKSETISDEVSRFCQAPVGD